MKAKSSPLIVTVIAALFLTAGCSRSDKAVAEKLEKIDRLESRVIELQSRCAQLEKSATNHVSETDHWHDLFQSQMLEYQERINSRLDEIESRLSRMTNASVRLASGGARPVSAGNAGTGIRAGVPAAIYSQIAAEAARHWPGNFEMQKFQIDNQTEAYRSLHQ